MLQDEKHIKKCDVNVRMKIKKFNILYAGLHVVDFVDNAQIKEVSSHTKLGQHFFIN